MSWHHKNTYDDEFDVKINISNPSSLNSSLLNNSNNSSSEHIEQIDQVEPEDTFEDIDGYKQPVTCIKETKQQLRPENSTNIVQNKEKVIVDAPNIIYDNQNTYPVQQQTNERLRTTPENFERSSMSRSNIQPQNQSSSSMIMPPKSKISVSAVQVENTQISVQPNFASSKAEVFDEESDEERISHRKLNSQIQAQILSNLQQSTDLDYQKLSDTDLTALFSSFKPKQFTLETIFVPFLKNYEPCVGEVDIFIKIDPPKIISSVQINSNVQIGSNVQINSNQNTDKLGTLIADEPRLKQTDPNQLEKLLRIHSENQNIGYVQSTYEVKTASSAEEIQAFIDENEKMNSKQQIYDCKRQIYYFDYEMYDEEYCQMIDKHFKDFSKLDLDLEQYVQMCCALLDCEFDQEDIIGSTFRIFEVYGGIQQILQTEK
ncbi:Intraflagellar_transport complex B protein 46 [Hexamita inflata]|uniref:Intraflagellar transport complex B protein 46 n=1 Tax=Hexamita inflata TaxID=28002 RepID=A0AA86NRZ8_9EUKA|nr:Intraflagellar transport complex B protein 46 [Hexamita inflata]